MALVLETGSGVRGANSYVTAAGVTAYLADRGRDTENNWSTKATSEQNTACIRATDYIESRWGRFFRGRKEFTFAEKQAEGSLLVVANPANNNTLTVGTTTYTMKTALTTLVETPNEILIGANVAVTAENIVLALEADADQVGIAFSEGTEANRHVTANANVALLELTATAHGAPGNDTTLAHTFTNAVLTPFSGGQDGGEQPLSFPRIYLYDSLGVAVQGVPLKVRQATSEYAVRVLGNPLFRDPTVDTYAGSIKSIREKIGPLETETEYVEGTHLGIEIVPYPAADRLLHEYVEGIGRVIR